MLLLGLLTERCLYRTPLSVFTKQRQSLASDEG
jgi:hypothetical protein